MELEFCANVSEKYPEMVAPLPQPHWADVVGYRGMTYCTGLVCHSCQASIARDEDISAVNTWLTQHGVNCA